MLMVLCNLFACFVCGFNVCYPRCDSEFNTGYWSTRNDSDCGQSKTCQTQCSKSDRIMGNPHEQCKCLHCQSDRWVSVFTLMLCRGDGRKHKPQMCTCFYTCKLCLKHVYFVYLKARVPSLLFMILWRRSKDHTQDMESLMDVHKQVGWLNTISHYCDVIIRKKHL